MKILVTGGAGYIGSHAVRRLVTAGFEVVVIDNLSKGHKVALPSECKLYVEDLKNQEKIYDILSIEKVDAVMHFSASIEVGESMKDPIHFYENNVRNTINLLLAMTRAGVNKIIFSSTAAVFGDPEEVPMKEDSKKAPTNVYGRTKLMMETIIKDLASVGNLNYGILRYFNAAGADDSGDIGEDHDPETHLIPLILQVPLKQRDKIFVFGRDYPTKDGTCIRDYIHVNDLADAHILVLEKILDAKVNCEYNLGSGNGYSVNEVIAMCEEVVGMPINTEEAPRRAGDAPILVADPSLLKKELGWEQKYNLRKIISSSWKWHKSHPRGYNI
ncbi:UDP-glucose 4-epimerase GalE [Candidatus Woesearchaeota archaeon]|jgi:UDP-glucose 4-epimerase|nr:UDP-glucose 4-epimerase GalE [Candidatus Woesearchaeota archaeon]MBT7929632.1 UDP-glucose 4-epimerase GalE [Candidatus Peregrinibacteria bacterium]MBT3538423.1 UDP-glucose 4-epimerase GalE [Candidatus Woesearchaeota archaeon]MBT4696873.1 UDP-glucose 4-epimerase GalE [Candidatus Woesearchaeota archaeon]MBT7106121.1 UDP-glucose 4-epimerase GalE [Candidatus Woesearchaeota archaeon]